ncbi:MAG TPA: ergosterol biosynthesis protein [Candidatus Binatia bacterium]|jgi:delta14-sterol reductase
MPAVFWPAAIYAAILALHVALPGRWVTGYVAHHETGRKLRYRLNGPLVLATVTVAWIVLCWCGLLDWDAFYARRWEMLAGAFAVGIAFTLAIVLSQPPLPGRSFLVQLYEGRHPNPQWFGGRLDAKMVLYLVGAVMLELNVLSFAAHHVLLHPDDISPGVMLHVALFSFFVIEYLHFEEVHLYTYDFMAERVGFKLGWGCLVFYPFFYPVGLWTTAELPNPHTSEGLLLVYGTLFFSGWLLSRGANLQKFVFKRDPKALAFGVLEPRAISAGDRHVLAGGFWGLSRHINYLGEILMASALALSLGYPLAVGPWLYPLYYVALLLPRQADDDRRCAARYGELWAEYCRRVPWRIVPYIY